jgi:hypothetical protein
MFYLKQAMNNFRALQETHYNSTNEPNRLMRFINSSVPRRKHITSSLRPQPVNANYRCVRTSQETYYLSATSPSS